MTLDLLPLAHSATIIAIDWPALGDRHARRLRELGFDIGVAVEPLHATGGARGPLAVRLGRVTIAMRREQAAAMTVRPAG